MKTKSANSKHKSAFRSSESTDYDGEIDEEYTSPSQWFEGIAEDPKSFETVTEQVLVELKEEAKKCHDSEVANNNIKNSRTNPNHQFRQTMMSKGTVSDKIAAFTLGIQENPVYSLEAIRMLVNMVKVGKNKQCTQVIDTLSELFLTSLLRPDDYLRAFHQRPLSLINDLSSGNAITRRKLLSLWYFEDQLKEVYTSFVLALNTVGHDSVDNNKEKAISAMYKLLAGNPEQEKNLLKYIVNKLGDPSQQVASKTIYCLGQLLFKHSNMQEVVLLEVEKLLFRPNISTKAQYYSLCFLSQFCLSKDTREVARKLIEVYFAFFKSCIKKGEVDSRMMSALLMGVNRAYPYAELEIEKISGHIDTIYRVVHIASFNVSLHALNLLFQVSGNSATSDRFYSALYKKLVDPKIMSTTHQAILLNLLYKALSRDTELVRVRVFIKRLLQVSLFSQPAFACGILFLISQVLTKSEELRAVLLKQTTVDTIEDDDDEEEKYTDVKEDEEEKEDVLEDEEEKSADKEIVNEDLAQIGKAGPASWHHCQNSKKSDTKRTMRFNAFSRNPLYAGGELCAYTELVLLKEHFHPSVSLYAEQILEGYKIRYSGDPLKDFTLTRFLDRFVFKNPKKVDEAQSKGVHPTFGKRKLYRAKGVRSIPVRSSNYVNEQSRRIPVDELFMHNYLQLRFREKPERDEDDSDLESVQSEEFEEMLEKMNAIPKDDEEDLDFMNEIGDSLKPKKANKRQKDQSDEEDVDDDDESIEEDDLSEQDLDEELDLDDDQDLEMNEEDEDLFGDVEDDEEDMEFGGDSDEEPDTKKNKKVNKDEITSLFASAEEFASLLEDEGSSKIAPGGSNAFENKDNADMKQIAWEDKRNRWLSGYNKAIGKKGGKKSFGGEKRHKPATGNKPKKFKK